MTDQTQLIHPGCIRIIAQLGHMEGGGDFLADSLPDWIESLNAETRTPMVRGTEQGAEIAKEIGVHPGSLRIFTVERGLLG